MKGAPPLVGVDGCRAGWLAAARLDEDAPVVIALFASFAALLETHGDDTVVVVDMPIGLPDRIAGPGRPAEMAVRPHLKGRQSSVFSMPGRAAVESHPLLFTDEAERRDAHAKASALARTLSDPPKGVSIQGYSLFPKILEIDRLLLERPERIGRVFEGHPEMAFRALNDGLACEHPKKVKNRGHGPGHEERAALLAKAGLEGAMMRSVPPGAGRDDLLDALAMLATAQRIALGRAISYPDPPDRDRYGLPVAIWA